MLRPVVLLNQSSILWRERAQSFVVRRRKPLVAAIVAALAGYGVTAFGVAPLMPDAATLPQRTLTESVQPEGLGAQLDALAEQRLQLSRSTVSRGTDIPESLLQRLGVVDAQAAAYLRRDDNARRLLAGRGGKLVTATTDAAGRLATLVARFAPEQAELRLTHFNRLTLVREEAAWKSRLELAALTTGTRMGSGSIRSSLFAATDDAGLPDAVATQMAEIFSTDIDFHRELRKGDRFSVLYEALMADGEVVPWNEGVGRLLAAEFVNAGRTHQAVWFVDAHGRGAYFGPDGVNRKRAFLASPLAFSRVTSGFAMRIHPVLQTLRAHKGVDYGAPTGTPVLVVGDGTVGYAGRQNGYGNVIEIKHSGERTTVYAHLSRIDVKLGQKVTQGDTIGAVGATGLATGPHLHFEFRVKGEHQDPLLIAKASDAMTLDSVERQRFASTARVVQTRLQVADSMTGARARFE